VFFSESFQEVGEFDTFDDLLSGFMLFLGAGG